MEFHSALLQRFLCLSVFDFLYGVGSSGGESEIRRRGRHSPLSCVFGSGRFEASGGSAQGRRRGYDHRRATGTDDEKHESRPRRNGAPAVSRELKDGLNLSVVAQRATPV